MNSFDLVYPMFAMVLLTCGVLVALFRNRVRTVRDGEISPFFYKTYQGEVEPESSLKLSQHFSNIFESPTLFYVACLVAMMLNIDSSLYLSMAWLYVLLRAVHAYVHIGSNKLRRRIAVYFTSWIVLLLMWVHLVINVAVN